jgi:two-component system, OmpR family, sensor histidine kinase KdpD
LGTHCGPAEIRVNAYTRKAARWIGTTALAALATVILVELGATSTMAGMVYLVLVVWSATQAGIGLSLFMAALCALSFDYYFLPPVRTFLLAGPQEWVAMISFAASSVVVSRVAERARRQQRQAEQRQADVERLYALSQEMMLYEDADRLTRELPRLVDRILDMSGMILYIRDLDRFHASTSSHSSSLEATMRATAEGLNPTLSDFAGYQITPLNLGMRSMGAIAWHPEPLSREVAAAVVAQISAAIARTVAMEHSARMEAAREAVRLRAALIDSLTHELRTPLTAIRAAATTLLQAHSLDEPGRRDLASIIDEEAARLDLLIGEAVEMAEIDANVVQVHLAPLHPRALLDEAVEESRKILSGHKVVIHVEPAAAVPSHGPSHEPRPEPSHEEEDEPAWFDGHLLSRVLRHLLENAAAYAPNGTRITLGSRRMGNRLEFTVEDNGPGIDALDLPMIFEKFYRGKRSARVRKGSGMGLAITQAILTVHGGGIEASNLPGGGASFRFWVPLVEKDPAGNTQRNSASDGGREQRPSGR